MKRRDSGIRKASAGANGVSLADRRERQRKARELGMRAKRMGEPAPLKDDDEPVVDIGEGIDGLNAAVAGIDQERKSRNKLSGEELEKWKANRERVGQIRQRQADASYYTVLVFDDAGQCTAFLNALVAKAMIPRGGDLFIDGRILAQSMGIELPAPAYPMTVSVALSKGRTKEMAKIPKGYTHEGDNG